MLNDGGTCNNHANGENWAVNIRNSSSDRSEKTANTCCEGWHHPNWQQHKPFSCCQHSQQTFHSATSMTKSLPPTASPKSQPSYPPTPDKASMPQSAKGCGCGWTAQASSSSGQGIHLAGQTAVTQLTMRQHQPHVKITICHVSVLHSFEPQSIDETEKSLFSPWRFFCKQPSPFFHLKVQFFHHCRRRCQEHLQQQRGWKLCYAMEPVACREDKSFHPRSCLKEKQPESRLIVEHSSSTGWLTY